MFRELPHPGRRLITVGRRTPCSTAGILLPALPIIAFTAWLIFSSNAHAASDPNPATAHTTKAMALLRANCISCHNREKRKGGLDLSTRESALQGGDNGTAITPGNAADSPLVKSLAAGADPHMPPRKQLLDRQIATLRAWVESGAGWDARTLDAVTTLDIPADFGPLPAAYQPVLALALSPDEKTLAVGRGQEVFLHDITQKERPLIKRLSGHRDAVQSLAFSGDGRWLVSGGFRKIIQWNASTWEPGHTLTNDLAGRITAVAFTPDHQTLITADSVAADTGWIRTFRASDGAASHAWQAHSDSILDLAISANGKLLATAGADRLARLWDWETRKELGALERHHGHILALAFNPDATWLATGSTDTDLKVWDTKSRQEVINIKVHPAAITGIKWVGDGKSVVTVCEDGLPRVFNEFKVHGGSEQSVGAREKKLSGSDDALNAVVISRDGKAIYGGGQGGTAHVWSGEGKIVGTLTPPKPALPVSAQTTP